MFARTVTHGCSYRLTPPATHFTPPPPGSHYIKKYNRYEKRHKNLAAHCSPAFKLNQGDNIIVGQCRPLSKTVRFNVLSVVSLASGSKGFAKF
jgi:hypothetical protein